MTRQPYNIEFWTDGKLVRRAVYLAVLGLLGYVGALLVDGINLEARVVVLRYWTLFATGVLAVAAPHVLLPDPHLPLIQLLNRPPGALLARQLRAWMPMIGLLVVPVPVLAYFDSAAPGEDLVIKTLHLFVTAFIAVGAGLYSLGVYGVIGRVSQEWQEGKRGHLWRAIREHAPMGGGADIGVPDGLLPALTATGRVFIMGMLFTVAAALAYVEISVAAALVVAAILPAWSGTKLVRMRNTYDRHFYRTNAFYDEIFRSAGGVRGTAREPLPYHAVYWVPARWKPHVWAGLRQLDRKLPLGRFILLGHVLFWILAARQVDSGTTAAYLLLFSLFKNGIIYLLATPPFAPRSFQIVHQHPVSWGITRFFINLRWTLPLLLSLLLVALFDEGFTMGRVWFWAAVDVLTAAAAALIVTYLSEGRYRRRYA